MQYRIDLPDPDPREREPDEIADDLAAILGADDDYRGVTVTPLLDRAARLAAFVAEYETQMIAPGAIDALDEGRYLLLEENTRGGWWMSTWPELESAAAYHVNQEYAGEWTATEALIDLDTGDTYRPGPARFTWETTKGIFS
jgi:hypothetical protein